MNMRNIITLNVLLCMFTIAFGAFGPKKLYTMDIPTEAVSVKVKTFFLYFGEQDCKIANENYIQFKGSS